MSEFLKDNCNLDDKGNFKNEEAIKDAIEKGYVRESGNRLIGPDGEEFYKDGTVKTPSFW